MDQLLHLRIPIFDLGRDGAGASKLEQELARTPGVAFACVNPATETAYLRIDPAAIDIERLSALIDRPGDRGGTIAVAPVTG